MKIVWSPQAIKHLVAIRDYIAEDNPKSAAETAARILAAVDLLVDQPDAGRPGRISGTREFVVVGTPYVIPYRVRAAGVELIAVFHGKQRWPRRL